MAINRNSILTALWQSGVPGFPQPSGGSFGRLVAPQQGSNEINRQNSTLGGMSTSSPMGGGDGVPFGLGPPDTYPYQMTPQAMEAVQRAGSSFGGIDPFDIYYKAASAPTESGFSKRDGSDPFAGIPYFKQNDSTDPNFLRQVPQNLQPLLAPALVRHYEGIFGGGSKDGRGIAALNAPWTSSFAPPAPSYPTDEAFWEPEYFRDPWFRRWGQPTSQST